MKYLLANVIELVNKFGIVKCFLISLLLLISLLSMVIKQVEPEKTFKKELKKMPKTLRDFIIIRQTEIKLKSSIQFSFENTLYKLIESHPDYLKYLSKEK